MYCATTEPRRDWPYEKEALQHSHEILPGIHPVVLGAYPHLNPSIRKRIRELKPKYLMIAGAWNTPTMMAALFCANKNTKTIFWSEGHADAVVHPRGIVPKLRQWVYSKYDAFAVPNQKSADWAIRQSRSKRPIIFLPNSIDCAFYERKNEFARNEARIKLGLSETALIIVQVAGLEERKGTIQLATSFASIASSLRKDSMLVFVGSGSLEERVRQIANESNANIHVTGSLQPSEVQQWLMAADAFVLNTFRDPNPLAPVEAGCAGLPVALSAKAGNFKELIKELDVGWAIDSPENPQSVLEEILMTPKQKLAEIGSKNHQQIKNRFDALAVSREFVRQLMDLNSNRCQTDQLTK